MTREAKPAGRKTPIGAGRAVIVSFLDQFPDATVDEVVAETGLNRSHAASLMRQVKRGTELGEAALEDHDTFWGKVRAQGELRQVEITNRSRGTRRKG